MNAWTFCLLIPRCNILVLSVFTNTQKLSQEHFPKNPITLDMIYNYSQILLPTYPKHF